MKWFALAMLAALAAGCWGYFQPERGEKDFNCITQGRAEQIYSVKDGQGQDASLDVVAFYMALSYTPYHGETGSTAHKTLYFYGEDGALLFTLTDLGNRNLVRVSVGEDEAVYQFQISEKESAQ